MTMTFPHRTANAQIDVAIQVDSLLLHQGLETILRRLPVVNLTVHGADVLITTHPLPDTRYGAAKALVLLDEAQVAGSAFTPSAHADGYLILQEITADLLGDAIQRVTAGEMAVPDRLTRELITRADTLQRRPVSLTPRESATLSLLADGLSNKQIARRLSISEHGAKRLVASVLLKLDSPNRTAAVVAAIKARLIEHA
ncbi:LuxR C-terminal-related transcriptional regulator [Nonomuraea sp. 10N515B]|uniref:LuxR C-terminal-related transcriptional regulator n=1 Tax=Nonomuraea sp. 10N515B TaxID=3457422 RepID=UPI003FCE8132